MFQYIRRLKLENVYTISMSGMFVGVWLWAMYDNRRYKKFISNKK